ncbi:hypothetical protein EA473_04260 [Natrarchaeobius chitinivorans]|uniref:Uncharacterized protein n=2 Tax=Natrarchaeobius chitinivorans TaxID=1679083 RepID=A0A3N6PH68_NATCH|nr:hypothetical protein EA473_04260 [Natrarchaeobius chitinivorans]
MGVGANIREFGHFIEECETGMVTVRNVEFTDCIDPETGANADVDLAVSAFSAGQHQEQFEPADVQFDSDGRLRLTLESTTPVVPTADYDVEVRPTEPTIDASGSVSVSVRASVRDEPESANPGGLEDGSTDREGVEPTGEKGVESPSEEGAKTTDEEGVEGAYGEAVEEETRTTKSDSSDCVPTSARRGSDVPPFEDPELLAEVYDSCDTFVEMSEAIEMDVTAETVRRYMIDYGIHEPTSYDTGGSENDEPSADHDTDVETDESESESDRFAGSADRTESNRSADESAPVVLTDGIGLPDDVTVEALVDTVSNSGTIYEVRHDLGLERDETFELLSQLDLVEYVVGRVATEHEREISSEEIVAKLRETSVG